MKNTEIPQELVERGCFKISSIARPYPKQNGEEIYMTLMLVQLPNTASSKKKKNSEHYQKLVTWRYK